MADLTNDNIVIQPGQHVVVVGLGISGLSAVRFCLQQGARVSVSDMAPREKLDESKCQKLQTMGVPLECGGHSEALFTRADLILVSPGVPLDSAVLLRSRQKKISVIGEMSLAAHYLKTPMLAVTGTNGKTTVTTLLGEIFQACGKKVFVGGNIGAPLTDYLAGPQDLDAVILELSSFQLDTAHNLKPAVAVLLNITADHLDRYDSFAQYALSKYSIFKSQQGEDVSIINADDVECQRYLQNTTSLRHGWAERSALFYGKNSDIEKGAVLQDQKVKLLCAKRSDEFGQKETGVMFDLAPTRLARSPNDENSAAAILAALSMGCEPAGIIKGLAGFTPLPHRLTTVAEIGGVVYVDDSKATNVGAVKSALDSLSGPIIMIAGGRDKGGEYTPLFDLVRQKVKNLLLIGEAQEKMARSFTGMARIDRLSTLKEAVLLAHKLAKAGDTVLLSPACASFDMFSGYAERGRCFVEAVLQLKEDGL